MNKILGNANKFIGTILDYFFEGLIYLVSLLVSIFKSVQQALMTILLFGGCLVIFILLNWSIYRGIPFGVLLLIMLFPLAGKIAVSYLKYLQYMVTEYFYEKADYYLLGKNVTYEKMGDYGKRYQRKVKEEQKKAQEEAFRRQFEEFMGGTNFQWHYGNFGQGFNEDFFNQGEYYQQSQVHTPDSFRKKYEEAADTLGVPYNADKYEIKLAFRKMAKMYHPDVNKEADATEKFQQINQAYDFLNDDNIARYKRM